MSATSGTEYFQGCTNPCYGGVTCADPSFDVCQTCPTTEGAGDPDWITCQSCPTAYGGNPMQIGRNGVIPHNPPPYFDVAGCGCSCTKNGKGQEPRDDDLIARYEIAPGNTGLNLLSGTSVACATVWWYKAPSGDIGPAFATCVPPYGLIAKRYTLEDHFDWHDWSHGVNAIHSGIQYELVPPLIGTTLECSQLNRPNCDTACTGDYNVGAKTCADPIWNADSGDADVVVRQKKCQPEVAIVTAITCSGGDYTLTLSREYHENSRDWKERKATGVGTAACFPIAVGKYVYPDPDATDGTGCTNLNYMMPTHTVTPSFVPPCSVHYSSGAFASQDFRFSEVGSGGQHWNYYNLYYGSGGVTPPAGYLVESLGQKAEPDNSFDPNCPPDPTGYSPKTLYYEYLKRPLFSPTTPTNNQHSCIQDAAQCGGRMWCNKLFFPRRYHREGTRVAPFGAGVICTQNAERQLPNLAGYTEINADPISTAVGLIAEAKTKFIDFCDNEIIQTTQGDLTIDGTTITVNDYLPLIGVLHPGFRYNVNMRSCLVVQSGCTDIPLHSDKSIAAGVHAPKTFTTNAFDSMGYWLDRTAASGSDECLFSPFKILIDVECNANRIRRANSTDDPTYLQGVLPWPSTACNGYQAEPGCSCDDTYCDDNILETECIESLQLDEVLKVEEATYAYHTTGSGVCITGTGEYEELTGKWLIPNNTVNGLYDNANANFHVPIASIELVTVGTGDSAELKGRRSEADCGGGAAPFYYGIHEGNPVYKFKCDEYADDSAEASGDALLNSGNPDWSPPNLVDRYYVSTNENDWFRRYLCKQGPNRAEVGEYSNGHFNWYDKCACEGNNVKDGFGICQTNHYCPNGGWEEGERQGVWAYHSGSNYGGDAKYGPEGKWENGTESVNYNCDCLYEAYPAQNKIEWTGYNTGYEVTLFHPKAPDTYDDDTIIDECGCNRKRPMGNQECPNNSFVKFTITESG